MLVPRLVGFDDKGIAIGAGFSSVVYQAPLRQIMMLPSLHIDFIDYDVRGKTQSQIEDEIKEMSIS